jgi:hypothetical protein
MGDQRPNCLILDEIDGAMASAEKGGVGALVKMIQDSDKAYLAQVKRQQAKKKSSGGVRRSGGGREEEEEEGEGGSAAASEDDDDDDDGDERTAPRRARRPTPSATAANGSGKGGMCPLSQTFVSLALWHVKTLLIPRTASCNCLGSE